MSRWLYVLLGSVANVILGTIYSWSVFRKPLEDLLGWSSLESGLPFSVFLLFFAVNMPLSGILLRRLKTSLVSLIGSALVGLGWLLTGLTVNQPSPLIMMIVSYGVLSGTGVAMIYNSTITVSSHWFEERRGLAVGLTVLGFGISPLVTAPLATYLIYTMGVSGTFTYLGVAYGTVLALLSIPLRLPSSVARPAAVRSAATFPVTDRIELGVREMVRTRTFVGLWSAYVLGTLGGFIAISLSAKYGQEVVRLSPEMAAAATATFAVFNGAGRPLFGYLADKMHVRAAALISFILASVGSLLALYAESLPLYLLSYSMLWLVFGGWLAIAPKATSTYFGLKNLSVNYGVVFLAYGVSALIGPSLASLLWLTTRSYIPVFTSVLALAIVGITVSQLTFRPPIQRMRAVATA